MSEQEKKPLFSWEDISRKLITTIVINGLAYLGSLAIPTLLAYKLSEFFEFSTVETIILITSVVAIVVAVIYYLVLRKLDKYTPKFNKIEADFCVLEKEFTHEYIEKEQIKHIRRWKLKALRDGINSYSDKFFWTGGAWTIRATGDEHNVLVLGNRNLFDIYCCYFDRTLKKGDTIEVEVEWILNGPHKCFFSTPIEEPTNKLIMNIIFPSNWGIKKVITDVAVIQGAKMPTQQKSITLKNGRYQWEILNPKLAHHYEIKWNFNKEQDA